MRSVFAVLCTLLVSFSLFAFWNQRDNAPARWPQLTCQVESSNTPEGYEVIGYVDSSHMNPHGIHVPCPTTKARR